MLIVSDELKNAFMKDERTIYVRIKIGNRTFDNDNVISVDYDAGSLSGEVFAIGSTYSNSIKITFSELIEGLKELDEVTYEIGIKLPSGTIEYVPMGVFVINDAIEMDRNNNKTTIECMDRMVMMGGAYVSSLNYPAAIREVALEIANKSGIQVADTFDRLSADVIAKPEGYTYREAIGLIAQFEAGFATFDRYGKLEIRTLSDPNFAIPPDNYFSKGLVKNEVFFRLGGISCTTDDSDTVIQSGNTAGNQVILENRVMTKTLLDKIYQKIQTINYYPFSLSWQGNPVLEAGDWVEIEDLKGNKFKTPNLSYSLSFNGGLSAKSSAETVTQSNATYQYKSPLQQKIEWIHARIDAAGGNVVFEGIDEPVNPKEGDLWFKIIGPDKEILIYRKREDGTLFWDPQISTADINKVAKELEKLFEQIELDREKAEQDVETAKQVAKDYTELKANEFNGQLEIVRVDVADTVIKANNAVAKANQSIADVGFMQIDLNAAKANAVDALTKAQSATESFNILSTSFDELTQTVGFKAEQAVVDAVTRQVDRHELSIAANAREIDLRMTSTQVDSLVSAKGYVNQAQLTATSEKWNLALTQVSSDLSGLDISTQNLVLNSGEHKTSSIYLIAEYKMSEDWIVGQEYTITIKGQVNEGNFFRVWFDDGYSAFNQSVYDKKRGLWVITGVVRESVRPQKDILRVYNVQSVTAKNAEIEWIQVVKGNKVLSGWSPAPEDMATLEQFTTIDATVKGLQTTVGNKADETKVTQLANQWTQTTALVNGHTGQISNLGEQLNLRVTSGQVTEAILSDKTIKDTRDDNQFPSWYYSNYPKQTVVEFKRRPVLGIPGSANYVQLTVKVPWTGITGGVITQTAESSDGTFQRTSNSAGTAWLAWDKVVEAGKLISQINISPESILIASNKITLSGDTYMDAAFINKMKVYSVDAVIADIATVRTKMLTADVILSTMIKSDTALVTKIFATDANVSILTAKTAFINSVKAIDISADRVTAGTLNAAKVTIINLDASRITTGVLNGIKITSSFNYSYDGAIMNSGVTTMANGEITMNGNFTHSYGGTFLKINPDAIYAENLQANGAVRSMFKLSGVGLELNASGSTAKYTQDGIYFQSGGNASVKYNKGDARIEISSYNGVSLGVNSSGTFYYRISTGGGQDGLAPFVDIWTDLNLRSTLNVGGNTVKNAAHITGVQDILFANTSNRIVQGSDNILNIMSPAQINMGYTNGSTTSNSLIISNWGTQFTKQVNFNGNAIQGVSNLNGIKTMLFEGSSNRIVQGTDGFFNILAPIQLNLGWTNGSTTFNTMVITQNQIVARRNLNMDGNQMVGVSDSRLKTAIDSTVIDSLSAISRWKFVDFNWKYDDKPQGRQFGLIAQDTPELALYDAQNDEYTISASKQIMMTSHGLSQLNDKVVSLTALTNASNATANQALSETQKLRQEIQELKQKIEQMESAA